jgi:hypothetical protein
MNERKRRLARQGEERLTVAILVLMVTLFIVAAWMFVHNVGGL